MRPAYGVGGTYLPENRNFGDAIGDHFNIPLTVPWTRTQTNSREKMGKSSIIEQLESTIHGLRAFFTPVHPVFHADTVEEDLRQSSIARHPTNSTHRLDSGEHLMGESLAVGLALATSA